MSAPSWPAPRAAPPLSHGSPAKLSMLKSNGGAGFY